MSVLLNDPITAAGVNVGGSIWGLFTGIGSSTFTADAWLVLHNIFNFTLNSNNAKLDLVMR